MTSVHTVGDLSNSASNHTLKNRHLQFLALGAAIGAGFFLGSGVAISKAGPALLLAYLVAGGAVYLIMRALGELTLAHPARGSFSAYAAQFLGPFAGFATGWSYWLTMQIVGVAELTGVGLLMHSQFPSIPQWLPALLCVLLITAINLSGIRSFGEIEFWLAMIKVATITGFLVIGSAVLFFHRGRLGLHSGPHNLWAYGGFFPHGVSGLLQALPAVLFTFGGIEVVGLAAAEAEQPDITVPRAIRGIFIRILVLYIGSFGLIMLLLPWNQVLPQESPFVRVLAEAGLPAAAGFISLVAIMALVSASNIPLFATSRMLFALSLAGQAPARFRSLSRRGVPFQSVLLSSVILLGAAGLNYLIPNQIFNYALSMLAWLTLGAWSMIVVSHLLYVRERQRQSAPAPRFHLHGAPTTNWLLLALLAYTAYLLATHGGSRVTFYIFVGWAVLLLMAYRSLRQTPPGTQSHQTLTESKPEI